jgi:very-short-patch-repair endonuclease
MYEKATDRLLTAAAIENGDRLLTKVRLADVIDDEGLTGRAKRYALSAHLDFVMVDAETSVPRFAIEFAGAQHWTDVTVRERDRLKDAVCETAGLPLLRITSEFTRKTGRWRVLSYVVDAFFLSGAFFDAQERGVIPLDEPFDAESFLTKDEQGRIVFNTIDGPGRLRLLEHREAKCLPCFTPDEFHTALAKEGAVQSHAFMAVATDRYLIGRVRIRDFLFQGVSPGEVAGQLAVAELADLAEHWIAGEAAACNGKDLAKSMTEEERAIDAGGFLGCATGGALRAGGSLLAEIRLSHA